MLPRIKGIPDHDLLIVLEIARISLGKEYFRHIVGQEMDLSDEELKRVRHILNGYMAQEE